MEKAVALSLVSLSIASVGLTVATPAEAVTLKKYPNCTALNAAYRHGVGRVGARDRVTSSRPVTNFYVNSALYRLNAHLDRDKDGVACEKR